MKSKKFALRALVTLLCVTMLIGMIPVYVSGETYSYKAEAENVTLDLNTAVAANGYYTVSVPIKITENSGCIWFDLNVGYDSSFQLTGYTEGTIWPAYDDAAASDFNVSSTQAADLAKNPYRISYQQPLAKKNNTKTGTLMTLNFKVPETIAAGDYPITLSMPQNGSILWQEDGTQMEVVPLPIERKDNLTTVAGKVTVVAKKEQIDGASALYKAGDITMSGTNEYVHSTVTDVDEASLMPYIHMTPGTVSANKDGHRLFVSFTNESLKISETRYIKIRYRGSSANKPSVGILVNGSRTWDQIENDFILDGDWHELVYDIAARNYSGGDGVAGVTASTDAAGDFAALAEYNLTGLLLRPFGINDATTNTGNEYFDIAWIALSNDADEIADFSWIPTTVKFLLNPSDTTSFYWYTTVSDLTLNYPETDPVDPQGRTFLGWDVEEGTALTPNAITTVKAVWEGASTEPVAVYQAADLVGASQGDYPNSTLVAATEATPISYQHFVPGTVTSNKDNNRFYVKFTNDSITMEDTRYVKIKYRGTSANTVYTGVIANGDRSYDTENTIFNLDGEWHEVVYDIASLNYPGGNGVCSGLNATDAAGDYEALKQYRLTGLVVRPFGKEDTTTNTGNEIFDIAWIALFDNAAAAESYSYTPTTVKFVTDEDAEGSFHWYIADDNDLTLKYPTSIPSDKSTTLRFKGWNVAEGTALTKGQENVVGAKFGEYVPDIVFTGSDITGRGVGGYNVENVAATETTPAYVRFTAGTASVNTNDQIRAYLDLNTELYTEDFDSAASHYMKIMYRAKATADATDFNNIHISGARPWGGAYMQTVSDDEWHTNVIDLSTKAYTGGEGGVSGTTAAERWDSVKASPTKALLVRPFHDISYFDGEHTDLYYDVLYVAFFSDIYSANAYEYALPEDTTTYDVSIEVEGNGKIKVDGEDPTLSYSEAEIAENTEITLEAVPDTGCKFTGWYNGTTLVSSNATYTLTVTSDIAYTAKFEHITKRVQVSACDHGTFSVGDETGKTTYDQNVNVGSTVTFVAAADSTYQIDGWYDITNSGNTLLTRDATYTLDVSDDIVIEVRFMSETVKVPTKLNVGTANGGTVSGGTDDTVNAGDKIDITATPDGDSVFGYWYRQSGGVKVFIGTDSTVSVDPLGENVEYIPSFAPHDQITDLYIDAKGVIIEANNYEDNAVAPEAPAVPERLGYTNGQWVRKGALSTSVVNVFAAEYEKASATNTATINYADGTNDTVEFVYDQQITLTATQEGTKWFIGDEMISSKSTFVFNLTFDSDVTITERAADTETVIIAGIGSMYDSGAKKIKFVVEFELGDGLTFVEAGVLLTSDSTVADTMEIGTSGVIVGKSSITADGHGFMINKGKVNAGDTWYGRPYIIYKNGSQTIVAYGDTMTKTAG